MSLNLSGVVELLKFVTSQGQCVDIYIYLSIILTVSMFIMVRNLLDYESNMFDFANKTVIQSIAGSLVGVSIVYLFGISFFLASVGVGVLVAVFIVEKALLKMKYNNPWAVAVKNREPDCTGLPCSSYRQPHKEIPNEFCTKFDKIDKENYDILDLLFAYEYISELQYKRVIQDSIFELPEDMVQKLLKMPVITENELKEARVIMNLMKLEGREITREEALRYIVTRGEKVD
jgi:hypothetical protein